MHLRFSKYKSEFGNSICYDVPTTPWAKEILPRFQSGATQVEKRRAALARVQKQLADLRHEPVPGTEAESGNRVGARAWA